MQVPHDEIKITHTYKSEHNYARKNQFVLLMITHGKKWHYLALKSEPTEDGFNRPTKILSRLFREITSNHDDDFYCLNCLHSFRTDNALKKHERLCENNDCSVELPTKYDMILKYNHGDKSLKTPFVIYADLECLLLRQQSCQNNPNESYTERKAIHEPCGYSLDLVCSFDSKEDKHRGFYRGNDCIKKFCGELKEIGTRIVNLNKKIWHH